MQIRDFDSSRPAGAAPPVAILAGGRGERLAVLEPKPLVAVAGRPFVTFLLEQLWRQGFRHVTLLTGHRAERFPQVLDPLAAAGRLPFLGDLTLRYVAEAEPQGTGGALRAGLAGAESKVVVMNGDSYCGCDLRALLRFHDEHAPPPAGHPMGPGAQAAAGAATLVAAWSEEAGDYGALSLAADDRVLEFREKGLHGPGWINAGIYVFAREFLLQALPSGPSSLEREVLPAWIRGHPVRAYRTRAFFRDIGTPERLALAAGEFPPPDLLRPDR